jgi:hypothetical protein
MNADSIFPKKTRENAFSSEKNAERFLQKAVAPEKRVEISVIQSFFVKLWIFLAFLFDKAILSVYN